MICCLFNLYAGWALEEGERKLYCLSHDLSRKLKHEKDKLRQEAEAKSKAERVLVSYLCHEIRNPFNGGEFIPHQLSRHILYYLP
jgi:hypothetical protein